MTFDEIEDRYILKIGQKVGNTVESSQQIVDRITEAYLEICRDSGCTYKPPALLTLAAVTLTTNKHALITALGLGSTYEIFRVYRVYWDGFPLHDWNKDVVEEYNNYNDVSGTPVASSVFEEYDSTTHDKITYISFYPFVATANSVDCMVSCFLRPPLPTLATWDTTYPEFGSEYHHLIADYAAIRHLRDRGDVRYSSQRYAEVMRGLEKMYGHYTKMITKGETLRTPLIGGGTKYPRKFYGE